MDYFGRDHLLYAIPAVLVLLVLSIPPPLLLLSYPLLWKIKAKLRHNVGSENDTTVWPIRKVLPLIDSFQGVFRDSRHMFAGLLFLWRLIFSAIFAFSSTLTEFYLLMEISAIFFLTIHAIAKPYQQQLIDVAMFANLAIINALSWYNSSQRIELKYITAYTDVLTFCCSSYTEHSVVATQMGYPTKTDPTFKPQQKFRKKTCTQQYCW